MTVHDTPQPSAVQKVAFVTGGCGFVGRHLIKRLWQEGYTIWVVDDLSTGKHPDEWLGARGTRVALSVSTTCYTGVGQQLFFTQGDLIPTLLGLNELAAVLPMMQLARIDDVFHLASVVGGRSKIDGDPLAVAIDLAIDAVFFRWAVANRQQIGRVLYASSSAAYPVHLQNNDNTQALKEQLISFDHKLGQPDMTYGWSKLTGEYLARIAARQYGLHVACVRPFSGYGGDQDLSYPVPAIARRAAAHENPLVVWGTGEQGRDFVYIDDCIEGMLLALGQIADGCAVNIGSGRLTTFLELAHLFAQIAGYAPQIRPLVDKPMGVHSRYADTTLMEATLHWKPRIALDEGMKRVFEQQAAIVAKGEMR